MASFTIKEEDDVQFIGHTSAQKRNINPTGFIPSATGYPTIVSEARQEFRRQHGSVRKPCIPSADLSSLKDERETGSRDHQHFERKSNTDISGDLIGSFRLSQHNIHKEETHSPQNLEDEEGHSSDVHLIQQIGDTLATSCSEKAPPCKDSSRKLSTNLFKNSEKGAMYMNQPLPQSKWGLLANQAIHWESGFSNPAHVNLQHAVTKGIGSYTYNECENNQQSDTFGTSLQLTMQNPMPYRCTEYEKGYGQEQEFEAHKKTHIGARPREKPYACSDCEKSFSLKGALHRHQRTHTGEKPYSCIECLKSFSQKTDLQRHQRTHTGEKPYTCTVCHKSFNRKYNFNTHRRLHTVQKSNNNAGPSKTDYLHAVALVHSKPS